MMKNTQFLYIWVCNIPPNKTKEFDHNKKYKILDRPATYSEIQDSHKRKYGYNKNYLNSQSEYKPFVQDYSVFLIKKCLRNKTRIALLNISDILAKLSEKIKRFVAARS